MDKEINIAIEKLEGIKKRYETIYEEKSIKIYDMEDVEYILYAHTKVTKAEMIIKLLKEMNEEIYGVYK